MAASQHAGKTLIGSLYLDSGAGGGHWLTEDEFTTTLGHYVAHINAGKLHGLRIFCACQLTQRPEYVGWAREALRPLRGQGPGASNGRAAWRVRAWSATAQSRS